MHSFTFFLCTNFTAWKWLTGPKHVAAVRF